MSNNPEPKQENIALQIVLEFITNKWFILFWFFVVSYLVIIMFYDHLSVYGFGLLFLSMIGMLATGIQFIRKF